MPIRLDAAVIATSACGRRAPTPPARRRARRSPGRSRPSARSRRLARRQDPRPHVRVVVEPGHHHLVAGPPVLSEGPRHVHRELGHRAPEHDAARVGVQQVRHGRPASGEGATGVPLGRRRVRVVGERADERVVDRSGDDVGRLGAARAVEVGGAETLALSQLREVGAHPRDVVGGRRDGSVTPAFCCPAPRRRTARCTARSGGGGRTALGGGMMSRCVEGSPGKSPPK